MEPTGPRVVGITMESSSISSQLVGHGCETKGFPEGGSSVLKAVLQSHQIEMQSALVPGGGGPVYLSHFPLVVAASNQWFSAIAVQSRLCPGWHMFRSRTMTVRPCSLKAASNRWGGGAGPVGPGWSGNKLQLNTIQYNTPGGTLHTIRKLLFARTARKHKFSAIAVQSRLCPGWHNPCFYCVTYLSQVTAVLQEAVNSIVRLPSTAG